MCAAPPVAPVTAKIFSARSGTASATARLDATTPTVRTVWRVRLKGAPSPASSTSSVYRSDSCAE